MKDRVPVNPGRVLITPENGTAPYYATMTRADNPTQKGTPLNKASLLKDATAAKLGLGADAVPDDAFNVLSRFHSELGNEYVWAKTLSEYQLYLGGETYNSIYSLTNLPTSTEISVDAETGEIALVNPTNKTPAKFTVGLYVDATTYNSIGIVYISTLASDMSVGYLNIGMRPCTAQLVTTVHGYVNSPNSNAYPVDDGYTYQALGQLGAKVQFATGSYTGTGTYGSSNKNSLTFDFVPNVIFVQGSTSNNCGWIMPNAGYGSALYELNNCTIYHLNVSVSGTTISWYSNKANNGSDQLNVGGDTYHYIAIC